MKVLILSGSRADLGILHFPTERMRADPFFKVTTLTLQAKNCAQASEETAQFLGFNRPDLLFLLGDRWEIMEAAVQAHINRIPIAHLCGGDITEGSYDDAMRDCISRMAAIHFTTSTAATARLVAQGYRNVHLVGNPAVDYIMHAAWQRESGWPTEPYVVVSYQTETIDGTQEWNKVLNAIGTRKAFIMEPNLDRGNGALHLQMILDSRAWPNLQMQSTLSHDEFLNLLYHCDELIGNSSAIFYEAPFLKPGGVPCRLIGKRQRGRVIPWGGEGRASERIVDALKRTTF